MATPTCWRESPNPQRLTRKDNNKKSCRYHSFFIPYLSYCGKYSQFKKVSSYPGRKRMQIQCPRRRTTLARLKKFCVFLSLRVEFFRLRWKNSTPSKVSVKKIGMSIYSASQSKFTYLRTLPSPPTTLNHRRLHRNKGLFPFHLIW